MVTQDSGVCWRHACYRPFPPSTARGSSLRHSLPLKAELLVLQTAAALLKCSKLLPAAPPPCIVKSGVPVPFGRQRRHAAAVRLQEGRSDISIGLAHIARDRQGGDKGVAQQHAAPQHTSSHTHHGSRANEHTLARARVCTRARLQREAHSTLPTGRGHPCTHYAAVAPTKLHSPAYTRADQ
eukprot:1513264-Pleurochrysis_carterae.AAC.1